MFLMEIYQISMKLAKFHLFGRQSCISSPRPPKPQYSLWNINGSGHDFSPRNAIFTVKFEIYQNQVVFHEITINLVKIHDFHDFSDFKQKGVPRPLVSLREY